jgi:hypothetical protein
MFDELDRPRADENLRRLLAHYAAKAEADREAWQDRVMALDGRSSNELVRLHGELLSHEWIEQNVGVRRGAGGRLDAAAVAECYKTFVDPGFVAKASHALKVCFPERAEQYVVKCFRMKPEQDRLYNIRNAINHEDIDADNPSEILRVEDRHSRLWMIVFGMLGLIIPIDRPLDQDRG